MLRTYSVWKPILLPLSFTLAVLAILEVGCQTRNQNTFRPPDQTDVVYIDNSGANPRVRVSVPGSADENNRIGSEKKIAWTTTNNLGFCIVFSPSNGPDATNYWIIRSNSKKNEVFLLTPKFGAHTTNTFKYRVVAFQETPVPQTPTTPGSVSNIVAVITDDDPFIIIQNN